MILFLYIPFFLYVCIWIYLLIGFWKTYNRKQKSLDKELSITIIIPFRNEILRWDKLLSSLESLDDSSCELKIIFINDHSNDGGDKRLTEWVLSIEKDVSLLSLSDSAFGKKQAINLGVSNAVTDWIFTLDADSYISSNFLNRFIKEMEDSILLYLLPVLENDKGFFLSKIESIMLFNINYSSIGFHWPLLANGAGMIFKKETYINLDPYQDNYDLSSGDDLFFLDKLMPNYRFYIKALKNQDLIVSTASPKCYSEMLSRAIRWSGKMKRVGLNRTLFIGLIVFLCNISLIPIVFFHLYHAYIQSLLAIIFLKLILDLWLLSLHHFNAINLRIIINVFLTFIFYPFHLLIVLSYSIFNHPKWKGRTI